MYKSTFLASLVLTGLLLCQSAWAELSGQWDLSWNSPEGSWKGLLEVPEGTAADEIKVLFDGMPASLRIRGEHVELALTLVKDGPGGEISRQKRRDVHLDGEWQEKRMSGEGKFAAMSDEAANAAVFNWKAEKIDVSGALGTADFTGVWQPVMVALSSWVPSPMPLTRKNQEKVDSFVWYADEAHRCVSPGLARIFSWPYKIEFLQNDRQITAIYETDSIVRRLKLGTAGAAHDLVDNLGVSKARLAFGNRGVLVETTSIAPHPMNNTGLMLLGSSAVVREKLVMSNDDKYLFWIMTVEDPESFSAPITRKGLWRRLPDTDKGIQPYECDPYGFFRDLKTQGLLDDYFALPVE